MSQLSIANAITQKRREKRITQDELANYIGVTKASVSKWETGQSYPDITLLPQLAAYFNISIDDLMGYEPQMSDEDIRKLYKELGADFTTKPFDEVMSHCRGIIKKYFSCFPLLFQIGVLYINYGYYTVTSLSDDEKVAVIEEAKDLFLRVRSLSDDADLRQLTLHMLATCALLLNNPEDVIQMLKAKKDHIPSTNEVLLSQAYLIMGKTEEAKTELQNSIYDSIMGALGVINTYLNICTDNEEHFDEICKRTLATIKIWNADKLVPVVVIPMYLSAAVGYLAFGSKNKALDMLEAYTELATSGIFPISYKRDDFFDMINLPTDDLPFGTAETPRDEGSIKQSLIDGLVNNPALADLHENHRYKNMTSRLKFNLQGGQ